MVLIANYEQVFPYLKKDCLHTLIYVGIGFNLAKLLVQIFQAFHQQDQV